MKNRSLLAMPVTIGLLALLGCKDWAQSGLHTVSINAPASIAQHGEFYFTVNAKDHDGQPVTVSYQWSIEWVGVEGSNHKGKTGIAEKIRVKGAVGNATLKIMGYDEKENWVTLATQVFRVE
jgi:hypothetical protein